MKKNKTSEAQIRASKKWDEAHPEIKKKSSAKSGCKRYIRDYANIKDLKEVEEWIEDRKESIN